MAALEEFVEKVIKNEVESSGEDDESDDESGEKFANAVDGEDDDSDDGEGKDNQSNDKCKDNSIEKYIREKWLYRIKKSYETSQKMNKGHADCLALADRYFKELQKPQIDWRTILDEFIQEEVVDYSFMPPDYRMEDSDFFLPGFNDKDITLKNILFMIDASGSMSDEEITAAYSEIKGAMDQFDGKLEGLLGFFDAEVFEPVPFVDESELLNIRPHGGGGTRFDIIFDYVRENMSEQLPSSIVILTDGDAVYPEEKVTMDIPVLWVINNEYNDPPWGKVARIK